MSTKQIFLPFFELKLTGETSKLSGFFDSLFFKLDSTPKPLVEILISCQPISLPPDRAELESSVLYAKPEIYLLDTKQKAVSFDTNNWKKNSISLRVDPDFDPYYLYHYFLEPLMVIWGAKHGISFVHASGLEKNNKTWIFPAWQNTGKTNTMISALNSGYSFLGDDYCVIHFNTVFPYPKKINLFSYNIKQYPQLLQYLPFRRRFTIQLAMIVKNIISVVATKLRGVSGKIMHRLGELAEITTNFKLDPQLLSSTPIKASLLTQIVLLQKSSKFKAAAPLSNDQLRTKLLLTINYELNEFFKLYNQIAYISGQTVSEIDAFSINYTQSLQQNIQAIRTKVHIQQSSRIDQLL